MICDLVIPAFNEVANIDALFDALEPLREDRLRHIVLADNGSTDGTGAAAAARGATVVHESRRGYGAACLAALAWIGRQHGAAGRRLLPRRGSLRRSCGAASSPGAAT